MSILNESLSTAELDAGVKRALTGGRLLRKLLPAGTELYKRTDRTIFYYLDLIV